MLAQMIWSDTGLITKDTTTLKLSNILLKNQPLTALFGLIEHRKLYIKCLEENYICNDERNRKMYRK